jgi:hypothetical protein
MRLLYDLEDFDAHDTALFTLRSVGDDLEVDLLTVGNVLELRFTNEALETAGAFLHLAQGHVQPTDAKRKDKSLKSPLGANLPPFLLSRAAFRALLTGKATFGDGEIELVERRVIQAKIDGKETKLPIVVARGEGGEIDELYVLDDERWPVVLKRTWDGECFIELRAAGHDTTEKTKSPRFCTLKAAPGTGSSTTKPPTPARPAPKGWPRKADFDFADVLIAAAQTLVAQKPVHEPNVLCKDARPSRLCVVAGATFWYNDEGIFRHTRKTERLDEGSEWHLALGVDGERALWIGQADGFPASEVRRRRAKRSRCSRRRICHRRRARSPASAATFSCSARKR